MSRLNTWDCLTDHMDMGITPRCGIDNGNYFIFPKGECCDEYAVVGLSFYYPAETSDEKRERRSIWTFGYDAGGAYYREPLGSFIALMHDGEYYDTGI